MTPPAHQPMLLRSLGSSAVLRVNPLFTQRLGLCDADLARRPLLDWIHSEDRDGLRRVLDAGEGQVSARHATRSDEWVAFDWKVRDHEGVVVALGLAHSEAPVEAPRVGAPLPAVQTLATTLEDMAHIVETKNPGLKCSILLLDETHECVSVGAGPSFPAAYNAAVEGLRIGPFVGSCGTASFWNVPVIVEDIAADPLWAALRDAADLAGVKACWSHPIAATDGSVLGAMALYDVKPGPPTQRQMDALEISSRMVALAVERERLEEQLRQAAKMQALGVLAGGIAHDFNNMLTAIQGSAELALMSPEEVRENQELMQNIVTACHGAKALCTQMLAYAGQSTVLTETLDCNELVRELGGLLQVAISKKATLVNELLDEPLAVRADRSQLRQVLMNLITNAAEAIGNREGRIVISTEARTCSREDLALRHAQEHLEPGEYVQLRVSDTGCGMGGETQSRIFDPFFTTKASGHGLGLAAVQGIVRAHGGAIHLESTRGVGTTFTVLLPRVPAARGAQRPSEPATAAGAQGGRVLVVDDEPSVRKILGAMLERGGHEVVLAGDGAEAIEVFRQQGQAFDCVLLDLSMPKLDGEEVFHELRKLRPDVRVILNSGYMAREIRARLADAGFAGFLQKPPTSATLLATVAEALAGARPEGARG